MLGRGLLFGKARVSEDAMVNAPARERLRARYPQYRDMAIDDLPVIVIQVERVNAWGVR